MQQQTTANTSSDVKSTTVNSSVSKSRPVAVAPKIKKFEPTLKSSEKLTAVVLDRDSIASRSIEDRDKWLAATQKITGKNLKSGLSSAGPVAQTKMM